MKEYKELIERIGGFVVLLIGVFTGEYILTIAAIAWLIASI